MSPFELLGLAADADERAIKRAYAQRLRLTRPDDDPQGFQQLHAAYQAALAHCRAAAVDATAPPHEPVREPSLPLSSAVPAAAGAADLPAAIEPPAPFRFDLAAFCSAVFAQASGGDAVALQAWLAGRQELWSLQLKARVGRYLLNELHEQAPPMPVDCMETLLRFFDLDHALADHDPLAMLQLTRRSRLAWQLQDDDEDRLGARLELRTPLQRWRAHWVLRQLQRPFRWSRVLWLGVNVVVPERIADFVAEASDNHPEDLPETIDRTQLGFWLAAANRQRVTRPRLILGGVRSTGMLLLGILLAPLLSLLCTDSIAFRPMLIVVGVVMVPSALWALWMAWSALVLWYIEREPRAARKFVVPLLCAAGVVLGAVGQDGPGLVLIAPALWLSVRRYWYHHASRYAVFNSGYVRLALLLAIPVLHAVLNAGLGADLLSSGDVIAAAAMLAWTADLRRQPRGQASVR
ncbi:hypothetical protein [Rhodanobacter spathiphylli]|uniref:Putative transmembrane chaperone heat shock protein n=1 Tax=Rhodanobacter spathiphylli B39 TaxID=1163407 RepID=I4W3Z8_9GAMM|nr:hypothetical protein [Rhodanobacter spathiphylli]EIL94189.1 putative transmembrane chaperone heat shock protein [Rhodanobacter spathiphylli B39]